jgi:hypothetical protein
MKGQHLFESSLGVFIGIVENIIGCAPHVFFQYSQGLLFVGLEDVDSLDHAF